MLNININNATKWTKQQLEKIVVEKLKAVLSYEDYAHMLKYFYAYITELESLIAPFITEEFLPDYRIRRNSNCLENDIRELQFNTHSLPDIFLPSINNKLKAFGSLYVLEYTAIRANVIVEMLKKKGIVKGVSFFSNYNQQSASMWRSFISALNLLARNNNEELIAIQSANETFKSFIVTLDSRKIKN